MRFIRDCSFKPSRELTYIKKKNPRRRCNTNTNNNLYKKSSVKFAPLEVRAI